MLNAALNGELDNTETYEDPYFCFQVPVSINGIPADILNPRNTWEDKSKYDESAKKLVAMFHENFTSFISENSVDIEKPVQKFYK
jgi:phosphoenolpyruvate carboxykinase (ATP)